MMNIISAQWYKVWKSKETYIIVAIMAAFDLFYFCFELYGKFSKGMGDLKVTGVDALVSALNADIIFIFIAIFMCGIVTNDYASGSIRQIASKGYSRSKIVVGQYIANAAACSLIMVVSAGLFCLSSTIIYGFGSASAIRVVLSIVGDIALVCGYGAVATLISYLLKSGGFSIALNALLVIGGGIGVQILYYIVKKEWVMEYWISNLRSNATSIEVTLSKQVEAIAAFGVIMVVGVVLSVLLFRARDVD